MRSEARAYSRRVSRRCRQLNQLGYGRRRQRLGARTWYSIRKGRSCRRRKLELEADYKRELVEELSRSGSTKLFTITNMPIGRFGSTLLSKGTFDAVTCRCCGIPTPSENVAQVMCRSLISVDWQGYVYDCDFNQMLGLRACSSNGHERPHLRDLIGTEFR